MKKLMKITLPFVLLFSMLGATVTDAKSYSSGRSSFSSSSSSSFKSSSSKSYSTPKSSSYSKPKSSSTPKYKSSSTSKTGTSYKYNTKAKKVVKPSKSTLKDTTKTTKATVKPVTKSTTKYKYNSKTKYYKPSGYNYSKYKGKSYYNSSSGFSTGLMTGVGTYLLLESFDDDGEPIYVDSDTGEQISASELDNLDVQSADAPTDTYSNSSDTGVNGWAVFSVILLGLIVIAGVIGVVLYMRK